MTRRPVQFGLGDLESRLGIFSAESTPPAVSPAPDAPPGGPHLFVHTGEVGVSYAPAVFTTVLGSCVAVCVWDQTTGLGGMNHYLLPDQVTNGLGTPRFGNIAIRTLVDQLERLKVSAERLRAKVFGGAQVMGIGGPSATGLGARNVELARVMLDVLGIRIDAMDVGGNAGRKVVFRTSDGAAWVRRL